MPEVVQQFVHRPGERLDYTLRWKNVIAQGETITAFSFVLPAGLLLDAQDSTGTDTVAWIKGGNPGQTARCMASITTSAGRVFRQYFDLRIVEG